jgi:hypothetical protein
MHIRLLQATAFGALLYETCDRSVNIVNGPGQSDPEILNPTGIIAALPCKNVEIGRDEKTSQLVFHDFE